MAKVICSVFVALMSVVIIGCGDVKENKKEILPPQQAVEIFRCSRKAYRICGC